MKSDVPIPDIQAYKKVHRCKHCLDIIDPNNDTYTVKTGYIEERGYENVETLTICCDDKVIDDEVYNDHPNYKDIEGEEIIIPTERGESDEQAH